MSASKMPGQEFGIDVWPEAGMVADRKSIVEKTDLEEEDLGGFPSIAPIAWCWINQSTTLGKI